jgi:hypothetical protein
VDRDGPVALADPAGAALALESVGARVEQRGLVGRAAATAALVDPAH